MRPRHFMLLCLLALPACEQRDTKLIDTMLNAWAPAPTWREHLGWHWPADAPPPDDAPIEALLGYWSFGYDQPAPSAATQRRLAEAAFAEPNLLLDGDLAKFLPDDDATSQKLLALYHQFTHHQGVRAADVKSLRIALAYRGQLLDDLAALADGSDPTCDIDLFHPSYPDVHAMRRLCELDPARAERTLAAIEPTAAKPYREARRLRYKLALDRGDAERARTLRHAMLDDPAHRYALDVQFLFELPIDDADAVFLNLAQHDSSSLRAVLAADPKRWTPRIVALFEQLDAEHRSYLIQSMLMGFPWDISDPLNKPPPWRAMFSGPEDDADSNSTPPLPLASREPLMRAMLPLLDDDAFLTGWRNEFIDGLTHVHIPEAVAPLRALLNRTDDAQTQLKVAQALLAMNESFDPAPLVRRFEAEPDASLARVLARCGMFSDRQIAQGIIENAIEAAKDTDSVDLFSKGDNAPSRARVIAGAFYPSVDPLFEPGEKALPAPAGVIDIVGRHLLDHRDMSQAATTALLNWLRHTDTPAADRFVICAIASVPLEADTVMDLFAERARYVKNARAELAALRQTGGATAAIAAGICDDAEALRQWVLDGDTTMQAASLAVARLIRLPLNVDVVARRMRSSNRQLVDAAEMYLVALDTPASREAVFAQHPGQIPLLGPRVNGYPGIDIAPHRHPEQWQPNYRDLCERVRNDPTIARAYFLDNNWDESHGRIHDVLVIVRNTQGGSVEIDEDIRTYHRDIFAGEMQSFEHELEDSGALELPAYFESNLCFPGGFTWLTRRGGRTATMTALQHEEPAYTVYGRLASRMFDLALDTPMQVTYKASAYVGNFTVVYSDLKVDVASVWAMGSDVHVQVGNSWYKLTEGHLQLDDKAPRELAEVDLFGRSDDLIPFGDVHLVPQPTGRKGEYWAAKKHDLPLPSHKGGDISQDEMIIGRFNPATGDFHPVLTIPYMSFTNDQMWVDNMSRRIYVAIQGDVVSIALPE
ncbi:MAG: hypothetical protein GC162_13905 [Planctomycetes bacterium]|nr:hypothetical protein [Planctomycetota bacterium]